MREIKNWRKRNQNRLTQEKLMEILDKTEGGERAREAYRNLTGMEPPEVKDDVKNTAP